MRVELIYEHTCPNIEAARDQLRSAFAEMNEEPHWQEWDVADSSTPDYAHGYGSPTILVNGRDVSAMNTEGHDYCCRVYHQADGAIRGVPSVNSIVLALRASEVADAAI